VLEWSSGELVRTVSCDVDRSDSCLTFFRWWKEASQEQRVYEKNFFTTQVLEAYHDSALHLLCLLHQARCVSLDYKLHLYFCGRSYNGQRLSGNCSLLEA
jgi:hypothetical protein